MFRFCKILTVDGRQFLIRAANVSALAYPQGPYKEEYKLVIDTTVPEGDGWTNLRLALEMKNQSRLLHSLECFTEEHARSIWLLMDAQLSKEATDDELIAGALLVEGIIAGEVLRRYGSV
jgi:hypothetical protein